MGRGKTQRRDVRRVLIRVVVLAGAFTAAWLIGASEAHADDAQPGRGLLGLSQAATTVQENPGLVEQATIPLRPARGDAQIAGVPLVSVLPEAAEGALSDVETRLMRTRVDEPKTRTVPSLTSLLPKTTAAGPSGPPPFNEPEPERPRNWDQGDEVGAYGERPLDELEPVDDADELPEPVPAPAAPTGPASTVPASGGVFPQSGGGGAVPADMPAGWAVGYPTLWSAPGPCHVGGPAEVAEEPGFSPD